MVTNHRKLEVNSTYMYIVHHKNVFKQLKRFKHTAKLYKDWKICWFFFPSFSLSFVETLFKPLVLTSTTRFSSNSLYYHQVPYELTWTLVSLWESQIRMIRTSPEASNIPDSCSQSSTRPAPIKYRVPFIVCLCTCVNAYIL